MPRYDFSCPVCEETFELTLSIASCGDPQVCETCGGPAQKQISLPNFVLKGDDWPGKAIKIKGQMAAKNRILDKKQEDQKRNPTVRLAPNVDGERVDSWSDAKKLAESKGKATATYDAKISEEKGKLAT